MRTEVPERKLVIVKRQACWDTVLKSRQVYVECCWAPRFGCCVDNANCVVCCEMRLLDSCSFVAPVLGLCTPYV